VAENQHLLDAALRLGVQMSHEPGDFEFRGVLHSRTKERIAELEALLRRLATQETGGAMSPYPRVTHRCEEFVQPVLLTSDALRPKAQAEFHTREVPGSIPGAPIGSSTRSVASIGFSIATHSSMTRPRVLPRAHRAA
jgi:hypothetical protein